MGAVMTILLVLSLGLLLPPTPQAAAYSCGSSSNPASECYAAATWPGVVDGASVGISIVPLYSPDGVVANQMWLKDTNSNGCTTYPYCWFEGGYAYAPYNGYTYYNYVFWLNPVGSMPHLTILAEIPTGQTGTIYFTVHKPNPTDGNNFTISYYSPNYNGNFPAHVDSAMNPNYIQIGMRLSGSVSATSGTASFTSSCYYVGSTCYPQTNSGNPANGYIYNPPYGSWAVQPSSSNPGGQWTTSVQKYNRNAAVAYANYWAATYASGNCPRNGAYPNYGCFDTGNDCTNFLSQVLEAGGLPQEVGNLLTPDNQKWSHSPGSTDPNSASNSWKNANIMQQYASQRQDIRFRPVDINNAAPGDFFLMDLGSRVPDHARVFVGYGTPDELALNSYYGYTMFSSSWLTNSHSNERHHVIWNDGVPRNTPKWFWSVVY
jgi:hypothetical protein